MRSDCAFFSSKLHLASCEGTATNAPKWAEGNTMWLHDWFCSCRRIKLSSPQWICASVSKTYFSAMSELRKLRCLETRGKQKGSEGFCTCSLQEVWILQNKWVYPNKKKNTGHKATGPAQTKANRNSVLQHLLMKENEAMLKEDLAKATKNCSCLLGTVFWK